MEYLLEKDDIKIYPLSLAELKDIVAEASEYTFAEGVIDETSLYPIKLKIGMMDTLDASLHPWFTYWAIYLTAEKTIIGLIGFKGLQDNTAEVGYGTAKGYRKKGYMYTASELLFGWAFENGLEEITAQTEKQNTASIRLLEKVGMVEVGEVDGLLSWKMVRTIG